MCGDGIAGAAEAASAAGRGAGAACTGAPAVPKGGDLGQKHGLALGLRLALCDEIEGGLELSVPGCVPSLQGYDYVGKQS